MYILNVFIDILCNCFIRSMSLSLLAISQFARFYQDNARLLTCILRLNLILYINIEYICDYVNILEQVRDCICLEYCILLLFLLFFIIILCIYLYDMLFKEGHKVE